MEAIDVGTGEIRAIVRERRGVIWCPFCDRSQQLGLGLSYCSGCHVTFADSVVAEAEETAEAPASTSRRNRGTTTESTDSEPSE
jgi:ribosomal protein L37AE/L43A